ncbi:S-(hydroxymethyl)glutathione dehydrogenase/alcohol dehydrogenase [Leifsonia sp. 115AMFTsu3.1]|nr:S-(hydroxymethyl)glutathione dehydrogenase/alcohol dehydrogenase [Leifsonia sp. 115AMFTsu3.1]
MIPSQEAFVVRGAGAAIEHISVAAPGPGEISVDIRAAGVCHSDLHVLDGDWATEQPLVLGHEASGVVAAVGTHVDNLAPGDHVVLSWFAPCRRCTNCVAGRGWLCTGTTALANTLPNGRTAFRDHNGKEIWPYLGLGAFTSRIVVPESAAVAVPKELPFDIGALLGCAVTTGVGAVVNTAGVRPGEKAAVIGCGGVGLSIIAGLHLVGANPIVAIDVSDEKLEAASAFGATTLIRADQEDPVEAVLAATTGGADYAFEAIGRAQTIEALPRMVASGGAAVLVGMTANGVRVEIDPFDLADQGKRIVGCNYGSSVAQIDIQKIARLYLSGALPLGRLIGGRFSIDGVADAFDQMRNGSGLRSIVHF